MKINNLVFSLNLVQLLGWITIFIFNLLNWSLELNLFSELKLVIKYIQLF